MQMILLRPVGPRAGNSEGITRPFGAALHGEGRLTPVVNVWVGATVFCGSGAHGKILSGISDLPAP